MTHEVTCVHREVDIHTAARTMLEQNVSALPVVDPAGRPLGIVSKTDLVRYHSESAGGQPVERSPPQVDAIMTKVALFVLEETSLTEAAALMAHQGVHRLAVVDDTGRVNGIISALDVLRAVAEADGFEVPPRPSLRGY